MTARSPATEHGHQPGVGGGPPHEALSAALDYAAKGWRVLPVAGIADAGCACGRDCDSPAKHPLTHRGVHDASTDPVRIRRWWHRWPAANIGVATGAASGFAVVDVDPDSGGRRSLAKVRAAGRELPPTRMAFSGGGGFHLFYRLDQATTVGNTVGRLPGIAEPLPGIDLRGEGGYVVVAPSRHASGRHYRWSRRAVDMAALPPWLWQPPPPAAVQVLARSRLNWTSAYGAGAMADEVDAVCRLVVGQRNDGLNRAAFRLGQLVGGGELAADLVHDELLAAGLSTGLGEREAVRTIHSGLRAGERSPRRAPDAAADAPSPLRSASIGGSNG